LSGWAGGLQINSDNEHIFLHAPSVIFEFSKTFLTEKVSNKKSFGASGRKDAETGIDDSQGTQKVGINESTRIGDVPQAELNAVMDITEDIHLYESKFESFQKMIEMLVNKYGYTINSKQVHELPNVVNCRKHLLSDGNPRYISVISITNVNGACFHILEVDTSDTVKPLSTQLLRLTSIIDWELQILELEKALVKRSLRWDSNLLIRFCGRERSQGVPHPSTESTDKNLINKDSIAHWAGRFDAWMLSMM
jgi:hypothetical protein